LKKLSHLLGGQDRAGYFSRLFGQFETFSRIAEDMPGFEQVLEEDLHVVEYPDL